MIFELYDQHLYTANYLHYYTRIIMYPVQGRVGSDGTRVPNNPHIITDTISTWSAAAFELVSTTLSHLFLFNVN